MLSLKRLALIPFPVLLAVLFTLIVAFYPERNLPSSLIFEIPAPFSSAHSLFLSVSALIVAGFFARGFLSSGSFNLAALGNGSMVLGLGFLLSQVLGSPPFGGPNQLVGISSIVFVVSGLLFGTFATLSFLRRSIRVGKSRMAYILTRYFGSTLLVGLIVWIVEANLLPAFFIRGIGPTLLREELLGAAILLFFYSSIVMLRNYARSHIPVIYWFSLGLASLVIGFVSAFLGTFPGGPFSWLGRITVALGGLYFIGAILSASKSAQKAAATAGVEPIVVVSQDIH